MQFRIVAMGLSEGLPVRGSQQRVMLEECFLIFRVALWSLSEMPQHAVTVSCPRDIRIMLLPQ